MSSLIPPDYDTAARDEGNAADWLAEQIFVGHNFGAGTKAPNGWIVTDDMVEYVRLYTDRLKPTGAVQVVTNFSGQGWQVNGRADYIEYDTSNRTLIVQDLKYGWGLVSPVENYTLIAHAIGWCINNSVSPDRIVFRIVQPRPYHSDGPIREWSCSYDDLQKYFVRIADTLREPSNALVSGVEQCGKCHARYDCPAFDRSAWNAMDVMLSAFQDDMPNEVLAYEHEAFEYAEQIIKTKLAAVEELMTYRITAGQVISGYQLKQRQGQRAWLPGLSGAALSAAAGIDLTKDGLVTPAEAERRGVSKSVVTSLTSRPMIGVKLERIDADAVARRMFRND